jgi:hypothetical protein
MEMETEIGIKLLHTQNISLAMTNIHQRSQKTLGACMQMLNIYSQHSTVSFSVKVNCQLGWINCKIHLSQPLSAGSSSLEACTIYEMVWIGR